MNTIPRITIKTNIALGKSWDYNVKFPQEDDTDLIINQLKNNAFNYGITFLDKDFTNEIYYEKALDDLKIIFSKTRPLTLFIKYKETKIKVHFIGEEQQIIFIPIEPYILKMHADEDDPSIDSALYIDFSLKFTNNLVILNFVAENF